MPVDTSDAAVERALGTVRMLADEIGPRRPTSEAERLAAHRVRGLLAGAGTDARLEPFAGFSTFAQPFAVVLALALAPALLPRRLRRTRALLAAAAAADMVVEGELRTAPVSDLLRRRPSQNVTATIEPADEVKRTLCLVGHLDSSRSGLMFHPDFVRWLLPWINVQSASVALQASEPLLQRSRLGRGLAGGARAVIAAGLAVLIEREIRGEDTPGANDNASGTAVCVELARELAASPLDNTRVVILLTGCEESGLLGAQSFLDSRDTGGWLFLNFDNVGAGTLHFARREGVGRRWDADAGLLSIAEGVQRRRTELGLRASDGPIGLTYDVTPVLARGGRGLTFVAAVDGVIPNYHWPTDVPENVEPDALATALEVGREMIAAIDRGEADGLS